MKTLILLTALLFSSIVNAQNITNLDEKREESINTEIAPNILSSDLSGRTISDIEFSNPYPNPVKTQTKINYIIPFTFKRATIVIRNIIGTSLIEYEIVYPEGKITLDFSEFDDGIYFYSLIIDGNIILTRKIIKK